MTKETSYLSYTQFYLSFPFGCRKEQENMMPSSTFNFIWRWNTREGLVRRR